MRNATVYVILTTTLLENGEIQVKISQEAYSTYERAKAFCLDRVDVKQIDDFSFCNELETIRYAIILVSVV